MGKEVVMSLLLVEAQWDIEL